MENKTTDMHPMWKPNTSYSMGDCVTFNGKRYRSLVAHRSEMAMTPDMDSTKWAPDTMHTATVGLPNGGRGVNYPQ